MNLTLPSPLPLGVRVRRLEGKLAKKANVLLLGVMEKMPPIFLSLRDGCPPRKGEIGAMSLGFSD